MVRGVKQYTCDTSCTYPRAITKRNSTFYIYVENFRFPQSYSALEGWRIGWLSDYIPRHSTAAAGLQCRNGAPECAINVDSITAVFIFILLFTFFLSSTTTLLCSRPQPMSITGLKRTIRIQVSRITSPHCMKLFYR